VTPQVQDIDVVSVVKKNEKNDMLMVVTSVQTARLRFSRRALMYVFSVWRMTVVLHHVRLEARQPRSPAESFSALKTLVGFGVSRW